MILFMAMMLPGAVCSNLRPSASTIHQWRGLCRQTSKTKLQNFNDKTEHPAPGMHDHHVNVSKPVDLRKAVNNKLLVGHVSASVRPIASDDSIIKPSAETVKAFCLKHPPTFTKFKSRTYCMNEMS